MRAKAIVLSTSPNMKSRSREAARLLAACLRQWDLDVDFADVCDLPPVWVSGDASQAGPEWQALALRTGVADAVVFAAPVYLYTVGSPARVAAELLGPALRGKPVGLILAAGSPRAHLAHRDFLCALADEVGVQPLAKTVHVTGADFDEAGVMSAETRRRIEQLAAAVAAAAAPLPKQVSATV